jgi:hypothetical protein
VSDEWHVELREPRGERGTGKWRLWGEEGLGNPSVTGKEAARVRHSHPGSLREPVSFPRRQSLPDGDLPFTDVRTEAVIAPALAAISRWLGRASSRR